MNEIVLTLVFIGILLLLLGSGIWVGISLIGVSIIGMLMYTTRPVGDAMALTSILHGRSGFDRIGERIKKIHRRLAVIPVEATG